MSSPVCCNAVHGARSKSVLDFRWFSAEGVNPVRRREFIKLLGSTAASWPLAARAQQSAVPVIGFLRSTTAAGSEHLATAFEQSLKDAGFAGQNVAIDCRWGNDQSDRLPVLAADLIRRRPAVIIGNILATRAVMAATTTIPIVFVGGTDPVRE